MKHMIFSFKKKGDVILDHFLVLWFQKDFLDTVGFRTFREGSGSPEYNRGFWWSKGQNYSLLEQTIDILIK